MLSYIGVRKWVGNPLVAYDFVPGGSSTAGAPGLVLYGLVCILPRDLVYTSIQPANAGDAPMAQEI